MNKVIWTLTEDETKEIEDLYEKKAALENLIKIVDVDNERLYQRMIDDYTQTMTVFNAWWRDTSRQHGWEGENWSVDFVTGDITVQR